MANHTHPLYQTWTGMRTRCYNVKHTAYDRYGGRGIRVCERWLLSFPNFVADMGPRPAGHTLDRKDPDGPYDPDNCRWATATEQARNRRDVILATLFGRTQSIHAWCEELGVPYHRVHSRLRRGQTAEYALLDGQERAASRLAQEAYLRANGLD